MIPQTWVPYHRDEDDELLGYLVPTGGAHDPRVAPVTVFGHPLADAGDVEDSKRVLEAVGLSYLADRWMLTLPSNSAQSGAIRIAVQIVEATPTRLVVQNVDFGYEGDYGTRFELEVPDTGRLSRD